MRYYIVNPIDGDVKGTDSAAIAGQFANSDDYIVIDSASQETLVEGERHKIKRVK